MFRLSSLVSSILILTASGNIISRSSYSANFNGSDKIFGITRFRVVILCVNSVIFAEIYVVEIAAAAAFVDVFVVNAVVAVILLNIVFVANFYVVALGLANLGF